MRSRCYTSGWSLRLLTVALTMQVAGGLTLSQERASSPDGRRLQFAFSGQPWRSVLAWLADSAELSLHINDLPLGSFTYSDQRSYTPDEAINRINMFLIPQRYTLVRSNRLLSVINLDDEASIRQLDTIAEMVSIAQLRDRGSHDLVKCLFPLGNTAPESTLEELSGLLLIRDPIVLPNTNQLLIMDTAAKLRSVDAILKSLNQPTVAGPVKRFELGTLDPDQVLAQVRPHVQLDPLAMVGADIRLSIDRDRRQLLASGSAENLQAIASVIALLHESAISETEEDALVFRPHDVGDADLQTVVNVLHTLLADEDVRLAADASSNQIAILAKQHVHKLVSTTIRELTGTTDRMEFRVFDVTTVDARYAAIVLRDMFAQQATPPEDGAPLLESPRIDADAAAQRIFVRARKSDLDEIERALAQVQRQPFHPTGNLRLLPYRGARAQRLLDSVQRFWPYRDQLDVLPGIVDDDQGPVEREIQSPPPGQRKPFVPGAPHESSEPGRSPPRPDAPRERPEARRRLAIPTSFVTDEGATGPAADAPPNSQLGESARIQVQLTPGGLLVHSEDSEALRRFEEHLDLLLGSRADTRRQLAVFYLKHTEASHASGLLRQLLQDEALSGGVVSSTRLTRVTLPADAAQAPDFQDQWRYDTATVIPDKRLNRLFVYGTEDELTSIESHLKVIDREDSIARINTHGAPRLIPLYHQKAEVVARIVRDAYAGRIAANASERQQLIMAAAQNRPNQSTPASSQAALPAEATLGGIVRSSLQDSTERPSMTLAIDVQGNSLVVTAPPQLADEVAELAARVDREGAQVLDVISIQGASPAYVRRSLERFLGSPTSPDPQHTRPADP